MKKFILNILIFLIILTININNCLSKEKKDYVLVDISAVRYEIGYPSLAFGSSFDIEVKCPPDDEFKSFDDCSSKYIISYYTKSECLKRANEEIQEWKDLRKGNLDRPEYYYKMIDKYYIASANTDTIYNYFCIPVKMWNKMKYVHKNNKNTKNIEPVYKTNQSFAEVMKKCGFTAFDYDHINLHDTPFICDKYNEKNPIPYVSYY